MEYTRTGIGKRLLGVLLAAAFTMLAAQAVQAQGLFFSGYADFEATWSNPAGDGEHPFFFDNHHVNFIALGQIYDDLFVNAEVEYEHAGDEIALEYGYFGYTGIKNVRIMAGKFIVPFGRFQKDMHPSWINKMVDRPHGFRNIVPQTYSDVGVWVSGVHSLGNGNRGTLDVFVVNGLMGEDGGNLRGMRDNIQDGFPGGGVDNNKAVGGRLGLEFAPAGFDIGGSGYYGNYSDDPDNTLNLLMVGVDAAFRKAGFELRSELVHANQEATGGNLKKTGGYAQASYHLTPRWEPVVRFSARDMPGDQQDQSRFSVGVNFYVASSASVRLDYHINTEKSGFKVDNDAAALQFNVVF